MQKKEIAEIKNTLKLKNATATKFCGCYIDTGRQIVGTFRHTAPDQSDELGQFLDKHKKCLSGKLGVDLIEVEFATSEVASGEKHKLLRTLLDTKLEDEEALNRFYQSVAADYTCDKAKDYIVILSTSSYDVPVKKDDAMQDREDSGRIHNMLMCAVCPVKEGKAALSFDQTNGDLKLISSVMAAGTPITGFTFPAFTDRATDLYHSYYYAKGGDLVFLDAVMNATPSLTVAEQAAALRGAMSELTSDCSFDTMHAIFVDSAAKVEAAEAENKDGSSVRMTAGELAETLRACDVPDSKVDKFEETMEAELGGGEGIDPTLVIGVKELSIKAGDNSVRVSVAQKDASRVRTQVIAGQKYLVIPIPDTITVNGVDVQA